MPDQGREIFAPLPQRRQHDRKHIETVEEIASESSADDVVREPAIRRRDDAHVHGRRAGAAEPFELAALEHAQELGLQLEGQLADFVEKDGSALRQFEAARLRRMRAGERPALAAEQLALDERRRQRPAIDDDEPPASAGTALVDGAGDELLAGSRLSEQQDRGIGRGDLVHPEEHALQRCAVADDRVTR